MLTFQHTSSLCLCGLLHGAVYLRQEALYLPPTRDHIGRIATGRDYEALDHVQRLAANAGGNVSLGWLQPGVGVSVNLTAVEKPEGLGGGSDGAFVNPGVAIHGVVIALVATCEGIAGWLGIP